MGTGKSTVMNNPRQSDGPAKDESSDLAGLEDPTGGMTDALPDEDRGHTNDSEADRRRTGAEDLNSGPASDPATSDAEADRRRTSEDSV
jgi:hypothetical protein